MLYNFKKYMEKLKDKKLKLKFNPKREMKNDNDKPPIFLISDFEGRADLLILFLIQTGVVKDKEFLRKYEKFLKDKQPKDYTDDDFKKLQEAVTELCDLLDKCDSKSIDTKSCILQFLGDYFGSRPLFGRTRGDDKTEEEKNKKNKKDNQKNTPIVRLPNDHDPLHQPLSLNGITSTKDYHWRTNTILCGTDKENLDNYNRTIELNQHVLNIMLSLSVLPNVNHYVSGNHEVYGSNMRSNADCVLADRFVFHATDLDAIPYVYGQCKYKNSAEPCKYPNKTYDDLDEIKNEFIEGLRRNKKPLQLFNCMTIGGNKFIFKHTNYAIEGQLWAMSNSKRQPQEVQFLSFLENGLGNPQSEEMLLAELVGKKGAEEECKYYGFQDITETQYLNKYNCFVCFGHTGQASKNKDLTENNNCLCVDCDFYHQVDKDKREKNCNYFKISSDGKIIEALNLYTGQKVEEFKTFQNKNQNIQQNPFNINQNMPNFPANVFPFQQPSQGNNNIMFNNLQPNPFGTNPQANVVPRIFNELIQPNKGNNNNYNHQAHGFPPFNQLTQFIEQNNQQMGSFNNLQGQVNNNFQPNQFVTNPQANVVPFQQQSQGNNNIMFNNLQPNQFGTKPQANGLPIMFNNLNQPNQGNINVPNNQQVGSFNNQPGQANTNQDNKIITDDDEYLDPYNNPNIKSDNNPNKPKNVPENFIQNMIKFSEEKLRQDVQKLPLSHHKKSEEQKKKEEADGAGYEYLGEGELGEGKYLSPNNNPNNNMSNFQPKFSQNKPHFSKYDKLPSPELMNLMNSNFSNSPAFPQGFFKDMKPSLFEQAFTTQDQFAQAYQKGLGKDIKQLYDNNNPQQNQANNVNNKPNNNIIITGVEGEPDLYLEPGLLKNAEEKEDKEEESEVDYDEHLNSNDDIFKTNEGDYLNENTNQNNNQNNDIYPKDPTDAPGMYLHEAKKEDKKVVNKKEEEKKKEEADGAGYEYLSEGELGEGDYLNENNPQNNNPNNDIIVDTDVYVYPDDQAKKEFEEAEQKKKELEEKKRAEEEQKKKELEELRKKELEELRKKELEEKAKQEAEQKKKEEEEKQKAEQKKKEAEKAEQKKKEAEKAEQKRKEAEQKKKEAEKAEQKKKEAEKAEQKKKEAEEERKRKEEEENKKTKHKIKNTKFKIKKPHDRIQIYAKNAEEAERKRKEEEEEKKKTIIKYKLNPLTKNFEMDPNNREKARKEAERKMREVQKRREEEEKANKKEEFKKEDKKENNNPFNKTLRKIRLQDIINVGASNNDNGVKGKIVLKHIEPLGNNIKLNILDNHNRLFNNFDKLKNNVFKGNFYRQLHKHSIQAPIIIKPSQNPNNNFDASNNVLKRNDFNVMQQHGQNMESQIHQQIKKSQNPNNNFGASNNVWKRNAFNIIQLNGQKAQQNIQNLHKFVSPDNNVFNKKNNFVAIQPQHDQIRIQNIKIRKEIRQENNIKIGPKNNTNQINKRKYKRKFK